MHPTVVDARLCLQLYLARGFAGHIGTAWCSPGGVLAYFISFQINGHYVGSLYALFRVPIHPICGRPPH